MILPMRLPASSKNYQHYKSHWESLDDVVRMNIYI